MTTKPGLLLLIRAMMNAVGSALKEDALTDLILLEGGDQVEHGFRFLRLSEGFAVFATPRQDRQKWYRQQGWPCQEKEAVASGIARKYGLKLCEPPDVDRLGAGEAYHHCAFCRADQTIIVAHPRYLKILVSEQPVIPEEALLADLAGLYQPTEQ